MKVWEILRDYLICHGFTGLVNDTRECGCEVTDLGPCGEGFLDCEPGYKVNCTTDCDHDFEYEPGNWHIQVEDPRKGKR